MRVVAYRGLTALCGGSRHLLTPAGVLLRQHQGIDRQTAQLAEPGHPRFKGEGAIASGSNLARKAHDPVFDEQDKHALAYGHLKAGSVGMGLHLCDIAGGSLL